MGGFGADQRYLPRRLGPRYRRQERDDGAGQHGQTYEGWREGAERREIAYEPVAEHIIQHELLLGHGGAAGGFTLVTGEPGSGKSRLLEELQSVWAAARPSPQLGALMPILVGLRKIEQDDSVPTDAHELANWLCQLADPPNPVVRALGQFFFEHGCGRWWYPLWLLDGLDELPQNLQTASFFRLIASLPGKTCVTCRTAIANAVNSELRGCVLRNGSLELLPLNEVEQLAFLADCFEGDEDRAALLYRRVRANLQLRELAGSPLLLSLIAEVGETTLPAARAAFYREAVAKLWERRVRSGDLERFRPYRDRVLTVLAASMKLKRIVAPMETLDQAFVGADVEASARPSLVEALKVSGLLRVVREKVEFLHLTLQEFYLAKHLASVPVADVLEDFWSKPSYEETLALLIAFTVDEDRADEADRALLALVDGRLERHRHEPDLMWKKGRSPLRLVFHLLARGGVKAEMLPLTWNRLLVLVAEASPLLRLALASDQRSPAEVLGRLACDDDAEVRLEVAQNLATPAETLDRSARDDDVRIRLGVAQNPMTPVALLERLAEGEPRLRLEVARNRAAPAEVLQRLAHDDDASVRREVAFNPAAPQEVLARLSTDGDAAMRSAVADNAATPQEILARLSRDTDADVRRMVAYNPATPPADLVRLGADDNNNVRRGVAQNAATPPKTRANLAREDDFFVRRGVSLNTASDGETLDRLARDPSANVRSGVAANAATPEKILDRLTDDPNVQVRREVARNARSRGQTLARLATENDYFVRAAVARNASTPAEILDQLARDDHPWVPAEVARNMGTRPEILARLAIDDQVGVHNGAARNPATLLEDLVGLRKS